MELNIKNTKGKDTGKKVKLNPAIFGVEPNDHAIYLDVKRYMAYLRQGTAKSKERAEISGSTRKIKRQKGTGTARAGSIKSPLFRGGGTVFGPRPRLYNQKINKKVKRLARASALTYKAKDGNLIVLEDFEMKDIKTKNYKEILTNLGLSGKKTLLVLGEENKNISLSSRNLQGAEVLTASQLGTYEVLNANNVVFVESGIKKLEELFK